AGLERAILSNTFAQDRFSPGMYERHQQLVALQDAYLNEFRASSTAADRELLEEKLAAPAVAKVMAFRAIAGERHAEGQFGVKATEWFETVSAKIDLLKEVEDALAHRLLAVARASEARSETMFYLFASSMTVILLVSACLAG